MTALAGVDIDFHAGEVHAILGENGAGKTTLVRILSGTLQPDQGHLEVGGQKVFLGGRKDGAAHGIGIVQQQDGLIKELTGTENYLIDNPKGVLGQNDRLRAKAYRCGEKTWPSNQAGCFGRQVDDWRAATTRDSYCADRLAETFSYLMSRRRPC